MDITPLPEHYPISVNGGMSDRQATEAHDPLHARCIVLDDGTTSLAIVVCDSCMIPRDIFDAAKARASETTGIPTENMLTSATHTHTAPTVTGVFQSEPHEGYRQYLAQRIADAIIQAHSQLEPAQVGWGVGSDPAQVFNRRAAPFGFEAMSRRVLLVEDDADTADYVLRGLRQEGFTVEHAADGRDGLYEGRRTKTLP